MTKDVDLFLLKRTDIRFFQAALLSSFAVGFGRGLTSSGGGWPGTGIYGSADLANYQSCWDDVVN